MTPFERLARVRTRLAMVRGSHMLLGAGCACGLPAGHIDVSGIDLMIATHLAEKYTISDRSQLTALMERAMDGDGLSSILETVINGTQTLSEADCTLLCEDIEATVGSLEELTRGKARTGPGVGRL